MRCARLFSLLCCGLASVIIGMGCSSSDTLYPVQGQVLYNDQPLSGALVTLHRKGPADINAIPSIGLTKEDGTFTIMTGDKSGAPAGEFVVTIICSETINGKPGQMSTGPPETQDRLKGAYSNRDTSKLTAEVQKGPTKLAPFKLN